jgi:hypothetical protein
MGTMFTLIGMGYVSYQVSRFTVYLGIATYRSWKAMQTEEEE